MTYETISWSYKLIKDDDDEPERIVTLYDQPRWDRLKFLAFHHTACKIPYKLVKFYDEQVLERLHKRTCNNDCDTMIWADSGKEEPACGRMPLYANWDCLCYSLQVRNQYNVRRL